MDDHFHRAAVREVGPQDWSAAPRRRKADEEDEEEEEDDGNEEGWTWKEPC